MLIKKFRDEQHGDCWALVSKSDHSKVLKWWGDERPSDEAVVKEERRVEYFKNRKGSAGLELVGPSSDFWLSVEKQNLARLSSTSPINPEASPILACVNAEGLVVGCAWKLGRRLELAGTPEGQRAVGEALLKSPDLSVIECNRNSRLAMLALRGGWGVTGEQDGNMSTTVRLSRPATQSIRAAYTIICARGGEQEAVLRACKKLAGRLIAKNPLRAISTVDNQCAGRLKKAKSVIVAVLTQEAHRVLNLAVMQVVDPGFPTRVELSRDEAKWIVDSANASALDTLSGKALEVEVRKVGAKPHRKAAYRDDRAGQVFSVMKDCYDGLLKKYGKDKLAEYPERKIAITIKHVVWDLAHDIANDRPVRETPKSLGFGPKSLDVETAKWMVDQKDNKLTAIAVAAVKDSK